MAFIFNFDKSISNFNFKDKLTYDKANIFLKQSSLINYSLVDTLKNYYNIFEIDENNLINIGNETENGKIQLFLENTLLNMMYKKLFNDKIVQDMYIEVENQKNINFVLRKPLLDKQQAEGEIVKKTLKMDNPLIATYDNDKGVQINHNYFHQVYNLGLTNDINGWGGTIKIPYLETSYNGHISNAKNIQFILPDPQNMNKLYEGNVNPGESFYIPHIIYNENRKEERKDLIFNFNFSFNNTSYRTVSKILDNYVITNYYNDDLKTKYLFFEVGSFIADSDTGGILYKVMFPFSLYYNFSEDKLTITLLDKYKNKSINYNVMTDMNISIYGISYN